MRNQEQSMIYRDEYRRIATELVKRKRYLESELEDLPEGELYVRRTDDTLCCFNRFPKSGNRKKERRFGIKKDPELVSALVRKKYVIEALRRLEKDIAAAESLLKAYEPIDENSVMDDFVGKYPELADGVFYGTEDYDDWASSYKPQSDFYTEGLTSTASDGTSRRSLGEILIGAKLRQYRIPYRYEAPVHPDLSGVPDFTIRRPKDGKVFYWEHFGKVSDRDYMRHNITKLEDYASVGIVPWDNLIITYSREDGGINEKLIDAMIHAWLL